MKGCFRDFDQITTETDHVINPVSILIGNRDSRFDKHDVFKTRKKRILWSINYQPGLDLAYMYMAYNIRVQLNYTRIRIRIGNSERLGLTSLLCNRKNSSVAEEVEAERIEEHREEDIPVEDNSEVDN